MMVADTPLIAPVTLHLTYIFLLKVLAFLLAYATILLGYRLIASGAKGEFKFSGKFIGASADLVSISPGLLFVLLAIALAIYAMGVNKIGEYTATSTAASTSSDSAPPDVVVPSVTDTVLGPPASTTTTTTTTTATTN